MILVINKDFVITRMITDRIGLYSVLLPLLIKSFSADFAKKQTNSFFNNQGTVFAHLESQTRELVSAYICMYVDECKVMDMKQTSLCSGFNMTFGPSAFFRRRTLLIYR